jgi:hypothetical protein
MTASHTKVAFLSQMHFVSRLTKLLFSAPEDCRTDKDGGSCAVPGTSVQGGREGCLEVRDVTKFWKTRRGVRSRD